MFIVMRTNGKKIITIAECATMQEAQDSLRKDFQKYFCDKHSIENSDTKFQEVYDKDVAYGHFELGRDFAYLERCYGVDLRWDIIDADIPDDVREDIIHDANISELESIADEVLTIMNKSFTDDDVYRIAKYVLDSFATDKSMEIQIGKAIEELGV